MSILVGNWWAFVIRGILAVLFGLMAFLVPGMALKTLVFLFGFYAIAEGVFDIAAAFQRNEGARQEPWWALLILGIISIVAGMVALFWPGLTALVLLYVIAAWSLVGGVMQIIAAIRLRKQITNEWMLGLAGVLSIALGVLLALFPGTGALAMVLWIGAWAMVSGLLMIALGMRLRRGIGAEEGPVRGYPGVAPGH